MAGDIFLKIDGIEGESKTKGQEKQIEIMSYSWGGSNPPNISTNGGLASGKPNVQDLSLVAAMSKASPNLFKAMCEGKHIKKVELFIRKTGEGGKVYLTYTLTDCMISSVQQSHSEGSNQNPTESFSIAYAKIEVEYKPQDEKGALGAGVKGGWDAQAPALV
jgi:type VI secretion system secreted protein Hcp